MDRQKKKSAGRDGLMNYREQGRSGIARWRKESSIASDG